MPELITAEYIWIDGTVPTANLRSKTKFIPMEKPSQPELEDFPKWNFDGSSTFQSKGSASDLDLIPVNFVRDPIREGNSYLVLCEVIDQEGKPHPSNTRSKLREVLDEGGADHEPWAGFEQEYTLFSNGRPLGWPTHGFPAPQGPYYCGVGPEVIFGRELVEKHAKACLDAGLAIYGTNAEVMPGQWEFQVGYRGLDEEVGVLQVTDHLWIARWLLCRIGEGMGIQPAFDNKPIKGDWNGAGCHTNFSTKQMRAEGGLKAIEEAIERLSAKHDEHIQVYGHLLEERLTGAHETCHIGEFRAGVTDRGSSIRIPLHVQKRGSGYLEDRRPGANSDPYMVGARLVQTVCAVEHVEIKSGDWTLDNILNA